MERWAHKVALVTGASAGIGAEIVKELARNRMKVFVAARRLDKLQKLAASIKHEHKIDIYPMRCDVQREEDILRVFESANEKLGGVDALINNVGVHYKETIIEGSTANYRNILNVNVIAAAICSRELVQSVKRRNTSGHIINISSLAGHYAELINLPLSLYAASKYAITAMAANLRNELANTNLDVKITNISPGAVKTAFNTVRSNPYVEEKDIPALLAKDIADTVVYALSTPHHVQISQIIVEPHKPSSNAARWYTNKPMAHKQKNFSISKN